MRIIPIDNKKESTRWNGSQMFRGGSNAPLSLRWHVVEPLVGSSAHDYSAIECIKRPEKRQVLLYIYHVMSPDYNFHCKTDIIC